MKLIFIINGENVPLELDEDEPLLVGRNRALQESHNTGRPLDEWEIRNERGERLSPWDTSDSLGLVNHARLFVSLRVGCGGAYKVKRHQTMSEVFYLCYGARPAALLS